MEGCGLNALGLVQGPVTASQNCRDAESYRPLLAEERTVQFVA
jgi:hypothetical protein